MKVLWLVNILTPELANEINNEQIVFGGWLEQNIKLISNDDKDIVVLCPIKNNDNKTYLIDNRRYYTFKRTNNNDKDLNRLKKYFSKILIEENPDIVHIHGTEYNHTYAMALACNDLKIKYVISLQGIVSAYANHLFTGLPYKVIKGKSFRNYLLNDNIKKTKQEFISRGKYEIKALMISEYVLGRTTWDYSVVKNINPNINYFTSNETLRKEFYVDKWDINKIDRNSIFVSQSNYPIKGLHLLLNALKILKDKKIDFMLYISGTDYYNTKSFKDKMKQSYYQKYLIKLIRNYKLQNNIEFVGSLNSKEVKERLLKTHVFISPSTIENSSNAIGEAMILGLPVIASYVGGTPSIVDNKLNGLLYQSNDPNMLAYYIEKIFKDDKLAIDLSSEAKIKAEKIHDQEENYKKLIKIYKKIIN